MTTTKITRALQAMLRCPGVHSTDQVTGKTFATLIEEALEKPRAIEFNTSVFEFSHGHKPSGRGTWAFCPTRECHHNLIWCPSLLTYTEAKKYAAMKAKPGTATLHVCP